ncbi:MAG: AMP-binding protein, partial [Syntrophales bacterium]
MNGTLVELLENRLRETPDRVYLKYRDGNENWKAIAWGEYGARIERFSRSLLALGVSQGDKVALIGTSSPDWFVADMSIMTMGAITVPIYFTSSGEQITYILNHSEAKIFIVLGNNDV